ncbi:MULTISPECIES: hypothetical protein [Gammaproteobacteria]|jgi:hypothetical protein|uniref:hypothetical protein n=1 Tax=Gammaproteobacteria TaxID=1236 RepID=UPI00071E2B1F|nr:MULTISPECIES: hypothetical protein [Gammaproteobacteria]MCH4254887.1 hypothetical protein [Proteus vulgaris]AND12329.1 hypothetical protein AOUC001_05365 [Proteus mirabilis]AND13356.1 hypothetical protein AOUC001_10840 [Proteus mirabilis]EKV3644358.1 hypothetical protein [Proteus mirabilis]ELB2034578.1 hypothetical protein [Proteus mirabilis]
MNTKIFEKLFLADDKTRNAVLTICETDTPLVSVLTLHLTCENFLEAFISAHLNIEDLFAEKPENINDVRFRMSFEHKNKLAQRLGMPKQAYDAFCHIDQIRNQFAHKLLHAEIPADRINKLCTLIDSIRSSEQELKLEDEGIHYSPSNAKKTFTYRMSDPDIPQPLKLCIAYFSLIRRVSMMYQ